MHHITDTKTSIIELAEYCETAILRLKEESDMYSNKEATGLRGLDLEKE